jgi:hypothetical protein
MALGNGAMSGGEITRVQPRIAKNDQMRITGKAVEVIESIID